MKNVEENHEKMKRFRDDYTKKLFTQKRIRQVIRKVSNAEIKNQKLRLTLKQEFLHEYAHRVAQLESAHERMEDHVHYISSFNSALEKKGISRVSQHIRSVENFLSDVYIYEMKVVRLSGYITRVAEKHKIDSANISQVRNIVRIIKKHLESIVKARGKHIHRSGYNDEKMMELELFDKMTKEGIAENRAQRKMYEEIRNYKLRQDRKRWKDFIKRTSNDCGIFIGYLYKSVSELEKEIYKKIK